MNSATKNILKASIAVYNRHKEPLKFIAHEEANLARLAKQPLHKARGTATQNHYQASAIFLRAFKPQSKMEKHEKTIDHSIRKHAKLSASGAPRWMACTPSAVLEENFENKSSSFAEEGTLAHEFAEINLKRELGETDNAKVRAELEKNEYYSTEMEEYVQKHVDYVLQQFTEARRLTPDAVLLIEERLDFSFITGEEGAEITCDDIIIADGTLEVIDLKFGMGVRVESEENEQLMSYGVSALEAFDMMYDIHTVRLTIVQPRMDSISSWEISVEDLRAWVENEVKPAAIKALAGEGEQVTGDHCKFCRASARCKAQAALALATAKEDFTDPKLMNDEELIDVYSKIANIDAWFGKLRSYVFEEAMAGKKWPGYKLVDGQNRRAWSDPEEALRIAEEQKYDIDKITTPAMIKGITELEKLATKALFPTLFGSVVMYKKTSPSLVPEDDKRPELVDREQQAINDFDDDLL